jgi:hypothetical protein
MQHLDSRSSPNVTAALTERNSTGKTAIPCPSSSSNAGGHSPSVSRALSSQHAGGVRAQPQAPQSRAARQQEMQRLCRPCLTNSALKPYISGDARTLPRAMQPTKAQAARIFPSRQGCAPALIPSSSLSANTQPGPHAGRPGHARALSARHSLHQPPKVARPGSSAWQGCACLASSLPKCADCYGSDRAQYAGSSCQTQKNIEACFTKESGRVCTSGNLQGGWASHARLPDLCNFSSQAANRLREGTARSHPHNSSMAQAGSGSPSFSMEERATKELWAMHAAVPSQALGSMEPGGHSISPLAAIHRGGFPNSGQHRQSTRGKSGSKLPSKKSSSSSRTLANTVSYLPKQQLGPGAMHASSLSAGVDCHS